MDTSRISERPKLYQKLWKNNKCFIGILIVLQLTVLVLYRFFYQAHRYDAAAIAATPSTNVWFYPSYQDVNVMMLIGFGFLKTFIKFGSWQALSYTFCINAIVVQYYLLWNSFWSKVMLNKWGETTVYLKENSFTAASYSVTSILIAFGAILGRVGLYQLLLMAMIQIIFYTLNEVICYQLINIYDVGGSTVIHTFGAYFGLGASLILGILKRPGPEIKVQQNQISVTFAMIGTLFLWIFWPSFNSGFYPAGAQERSIIISNTIIALTGSCLGAFIISSGFRQKLDMQDVLNATLAGGVVIGAPSGLFTNPAASLTVGLLTGMISTFGYMYLTKFLSVKIKLMDTCGVHNLHGIPGLLGGILSSIAIAAYRSSPMDIGIGSNLPFFPNPVKGRTLNEQAWWQILGTVTSLGIGILSGMLAGYLMSLSYGFRNRHYYRDTAFFETPEQEWLKQPEAGSTIFNPRISEIELKSAKKTRQ